MKLNSDLKDCTAAPISEVISWLPDAESPDVIDVCQAVPAYSPPEEMLAYMADLVRSGKAGTYTDIEGIPKLRESLATDINNRYGGNVDADQIIITAGCNQGFCNAVDSLCQRGDNVIVPLPCYFNHEMWLTIRGVEIRWLPFNAESGIPDPAEVERLVDARTRAVVLVTPNNPTGAVYPANTIAEFWQQACSHDIALIIDETYRDFMDDSAPPHDMFSEDNWEDNFIHLYSFSKAFSLTGYRVGAIVAGRDTIAQVGKIQDCVAICAPHIGQEAADFGLNNLQHWRRDRGRELMARAEAIKDAFDRDGLGYSIVSAGAYFAWVQHPFNESALSVAKRLAREFNIACLPGNYFGDGQEQFFRFAFSNIEESRFPELVDRLMESQ